MTTKKVLKKTAKKLDSILRKLETCELHQLIPLTLEYLETLFSVFENSKTKKKFSCGGNVHYIKRGSKRNTNRSRIGLVGTGKVARSKDQQNSAQRLNEAFSL